jgi:hypothetical protein
MTIGTGYAGRSSVGENLRPDHLVNWVRLAHNADRTVPMGDFSALSPWPATAGPVPPYPVASNAHADAVPDPVSDTVPATVPSLEPGTEDLRDELRRIIIEELHDLIGGGGPRA